jgi:hypothetical protein
MTDDISRRDFVKQTVVGTAVLTGASTSLDALQWHHRLRDAELPADGLDLFNTSARQYFDGKTFLELDEADRRMAPDGCEPFLTRQLDEGFCLICG